MSLKPTINNLKKTITNLKKIATNFESGKINLRILLNKLETEKQVSFLEDTLKSILESPDNLQKRAIAEAITMLHNFRAKLIAMSIETMQKLTKLRPRIPVRRYGGNVVEVTPATLTVALAYANKIANQYLAKNSRIDFLTPLQTLLEKLGKLVLLHNNNVIKVAEIRGKIITLLPGYNLKSSLLEQEESGDK